MIVDNVVDNELAIESANRKRVSVYLYDVVDFITGAFLLVNYVIVLMQVYYQILVFIRYNNISILVKQLRSFHSFQLHNLLLLLFQTNTVIDADLLLLYYIQLISHYQYVHHVHHLIHLNTLYYRTLQIHYHYSTIITIHVDPSVYPVQIATQYLLSLLHSYYLRLSYTLLFIYHPYYYLINQHRYYFLLLEKHPHTIII